jgi:hypothetical protein
MAAGRERGALTECPRRERQARESVSDTCYPRGTRPRPRSTFWDSGIPPSPRTYFADAAEFLEGSRCRIRILLLDVLGEECSKDIVSNVRQSATSLSRRRRAQHAATRSRGAVSQCLSSTPRRERQARESVSDTCYPRYGSRKREGGSHRM